MTIESPKPSKETRSFARRAFLGTSGAAAIAGVAAVAVKNTAPPAAPTPEPVADDDSASGYRATDHVQKYYRTARV